MWKRGKHARRSGTFPLELCGLCARTFPAGEAVSGHVPDSSFAHPADDRADGPCRVTACGEAHLDAVRETYRSRPFAQEELRAAGITRVLTSGPPVLTVERLACRTGPHEPDIRRVIARYDERRRRTAGDGPGGGAVSPSAAAGSGPAGRPGSPCR